MEESRSVVVDGQDCLLTFEGVTTIKSGTTGSVSVYYAELVVGGVSKTKFVPPLIIDRLVDHEKIGDVSDARSLKSYRIVSGCKWVAERKRERHRESVCKREKTVDSLAREGVEEGRGGP